MSGSFEELASLKQRLLFGTRLIVAIPPAVISRKIRYEVQANRANGDCLDTFLVAIEVKFMVGAKLYSIQRYCYEKTMM